jgi:hypothetical protein
VVVVRVMNWLSEMGMVRRMMFRLWKVWVMDCVMFRLRHVRHSVLVSFIVKLLFAAVIPDFVICMVIPKLMIIVNIVLIPMLRIFKVVILLVCKVMGLKVASNVVVWLRNMRHKVGSPMSPFIPLVVVLVAVGGLVFVAVVALMAIEMSICVIVFMAVVIIVMFIIIMMISGVGWILVVDQMEALHRDMMVLIVSSMVLVLVVPQLMIISQSFVGEVTSDLLF